MLTQEQANNIFKYDPETGVVSLRRPTRGEGTGYIDDLGYIRFYTPFGHVRAHQVAWLIMTGEWTQVDHKDLIRTNNRFSNLRKSTQSQNLANRPKGINNTSGIKGVSFCSSTEKWRADICIFGRTKNLGRYLTKDEAAAVYIKAAKELFGEFARSG